MERKTLFYGATVLVAAVIVTAFAGCSSDSANPYGVTAPPSAVPPNTVVMSGSTFSPASLIVTRGTTVTWRNDDAAVHTSASDTTGWDTGNIAPGGSATTQCNTAGTFHYHCLYHRAMGMVGTITVQ